MRTSIWKYMQTVVAAVLVSTMALAGAIDVQVSPLSAAGWTYTGAQSLATLDAAVTQGNCIYLNGNTRSIGWCLNGSSNVILVGSSPLTPGSDQAINLGNLTGPVRWSNSYIFTMNTWDPVVHQDFVDDSATTGNRTVNASRGFNAYAAAGTAITITNSKVTAASQIVATIMTNDATAILKNCVPAAGSFTCTLNAAATGITKIAWTVEK